MNVRIEINLNRRSMSWPRILWNRATRTRGEQTARSFLVKASTQETPVMVQHHGLKMRLTPQKIGDNPFDLEYKSGFRRSLYRAGITRIDITQADPDKIIPILNACTDHGLNGMKKALEANSATLVIKDKITFPITFKSMFTSKFKGLLKTISDYFTLRKYLRLDDPNNFPPKKARNLAEDTLTALIRLAKHNDKAVLAYLSALPDNQLNFINKFLLPLKRFQKTHHLFPRFIRDLAAPVGFRAKLFFTHHAYITLPVSNSEKLARQILFTAFEQAQKAEK